VHGNLHRGVQGEPRAAFSKRRSPFGPRRCKTELF
jgi:hypothetical protein